MTKYPRVLFLRRSAESPRYGDIQAVAKEQCWQVFMAPEAVLPAAGCRFDGALVFTDGAPAVAALARDLRARGTPVVDFSPAGAADGLAVAAADDVQIGRLAARHYRERKFRHFVFFSRRWSAARALRARGFREECAAGAGDVREWVWAREAEEAARFDARAFTRWLERKVRTAPKPVGVFCFDDHDAMSVINACEITGAALPDDVSILGVGNLRDICEKECITISSVRLDRAALGAAGARLLGRLMAGGRAPDEPLLVAPTGIVERQSTDVIGTDNPMLRRVLEHIRRHLGDPLSAATVCAALKIGRNHLDRLFAAELGHSVGREILRQRVAAVKLRLRGSAAKLDSIAAEAGFCSASYLIKAFRRETGQTPYVWKRNA